jgi:uncharacterized protein (DUF488 family)
LSAASLPPVFTVGHSTRTIPEFVDLLREGRVDLVVDIRTIPRSRTNPQYNLDTLPAELEPYQIGHCRIAELGGLRGRTHEVPPDTNGFWNNRSFHNYADHALSDDFQRGLDELLAVSAERRTAIMCSEAVWWRCHRRIVADYLMLHGREVVHLMGGGRLEPAKRTPSARERDGRLVYPAG